MSGGRLQNDFFNQFAETMCANGFTVTPTHGKDAFLRRWANSKPTNSEWLRRMVRSNRYPGCNIGIVCGRVVAIDIDAEDPAEVERLKILAAECLGATSFERIGRYPRTLLLYRPIGSIPSSRVGCTEVLSFGKQFIAYGIHPDTGRPYEWTDSHFNPATAKLDDVPTITAAKLTAFAEAIAQPHGSLLKAIPALTLETATATLKARQQARQGEMLSSGILDARIQRDVRGFVIDGREAFLTKLTAAEYAKGTHVTPGDLANRVWSRFASDADLARPKGSNPKQRWSVKDALAKARSTCRRKPDLKAPRRSRGGHPASGLHAFRRPGFWTQAQRELHLAAVRQRITTPAFVAVACVMIEAVDLVSGFCTRSVAELAKRTSCSTKTVTKARAALTKTGLWIAGHRGVFVPVALNCNQVVDNTRVKEQRGHTKVPHLYHLSTVPVPVPVSIPSSLVPAVATTLRPYQADMFGCTVVDLDQYRRGLLPSDVVAAIRAEMRARGVTQGELAAELGISQPQIANALAGRFGLSGDVAARLLAWLREAA
jgi:Bifunctional DNA primase/polymerase, N-terminal